MLLPYATNENNSLNEEAKLALYHMLCLPHDEWRPVVMYAIKEVCKQIHDVLLGSIACRLCLDGGASTSKPNAQHQQLHCQNNPGCSWLAHTRCSNG